MILAASIDLSGIGIDYTAILPELVVAATAIVVLLLELFVPPGQRRILAAVTVVGLIGALVANIPLWGQNKTAFAGTVSGDSLAAFLNVVLIGVTIFTAIISPRYLRALRLDYGEYYILLLGATLGMMLLAAATSLMTIFLGIELLSICLYVLCGFARAQLRSQESALKYLLLGGFATGFLLYGMALIYGATGSTVLSKIAAASGHDFGSNLLILGVLLMGIGFAFKVSAAPFQMWTPDVYEGSPIPVTAFMSVGTKAAAFAMIIRVFAGGLPHLAPEWQVLLAFVAATSMVVGNVMAIAQSSLKRLLAYSGVAQAGYILIGVIAGGDAGLSAVLYYLFIYMFMNFGAFAVITLLAGPDGDRDGFADLEGLGRRNPVLGILMTIFMLSLAGFPPTVGFFGKLFLFTAGVSAGYTWLVVLAVLMSVVSVFYYVRVLIPVWSTSSRTDAVPSSLTTTSVVALAGVASLALGLYPTTLLLVGQLASNPNPGP